MNIEQIDLKEANLEELNIKSWFEEHAEPYRLHETNLYMRDIWRIAEGGEIIGFALIYPNRTTGEVTFTLLGVKEEYQGQGIARRIVHHMIGEYGEMIFHSEADGESYKFLDSFGFERIGELKDDGKTFISWKGTPEDIK